MAGPTAVTHTELYPTHDITLSDGTDSVGFIFCDGKGNPMPNFDRVGMPSDALLASQGESEYSTYEPGYMRIEQTDWSGGRGLNDFDKDKTRYFDGTNIYPMSDGVILGPQEHFADNLNVENKYLPDDMTAGNLHDSNGLYSDTRFYSSDNFDPGSANYDALYIEFWAMKIGKPGTLTVSLW